MVRPLMRGLMASHVRWRMSQDVR